MKKLLVGLLAFGSFSSFAQGLEGEFRIFAGGSNNGTYDFRELEEVKFDADVEVNVELSAGTCIFKAHGDREVNNIDITVIDSSGNESSAMFDIESKMKFYELNLNKLKCAIKWIR